jgi:HlyD family secretion protein
MNYETGFTREVSPDQTYTAEPYADGAPRGGNKRWLIIAALLAVAVLVGAYFLFGRDAAAPVAGAKTSEKGAAAGKDDKAAPRVTVVIPGRQPVESVVTATGTLAARRDMPVGAVGEGGLVTRVLVEPGQWVQAGQVLAVVDRQVQAQQSNQLAAQISVAQADARIAQAELDRAQALVKRGFISKADIDRKTATRDAASARVRVAQAQLAENRARTARLDIRSPASGRVLTRSVEPGQVVGAGGGTPLFRIAKDGEMELHAQMSEADLVRMGVGMRASVVPVGSTQAFAGTVWQLSPVIDPQSRQGMVRIALGSNVALRPGGFASASISSGSVDAPLLPESAVLSDPKGNYVFVVGSDNKVERRDVKVGSVTDGGVSVIEGLAGTEQVVLSAGGFLNAGEAIIPDRAKPAR